MSVPRVLLTSWTLPLALLSTLVLVACAEAGEPKIEELEPNADTRYELQDRIGSASVILDQEGAVVTHTALAPYGETWAEDKQAGERGAVYRFTDKELDTGVGTIYIGMRHYVPELRRWASPDPKFSWQDPSAIVSDPQEGNLYRYGANSPVMQVDPDGRDALTWELGATMTLLWGKRGDSAGLAFDDRGRLAIIDSTSWEASSGDAGVGARAKMGYHFNKNGVTDLAGTSHQVGVSAGEIGAVGASYGTSATNQSVYVEAGPEVGVVPVEFSAGQTDTRVTQIGRLPGAGAIYSLVSQPKVSDSIKRSAPARAASVETPSAGPSLDGGYSQPPATSSASMIEPPPCSNCSY